MNCLRKFIDTYDSFLGRDGKKIWIGKLQNWWNKNAKHKWSVVVVDQWLCIVVQWAYEHLCWRKVDILNNKYDDNYDMNNIRLGLFEILVEFHIISQGRGETCFRYSGIFINHFIADFPLSASERLFWKSVGNLWSHDKNLLAEFFDSRCKNTPATNFSNISMYLLCVEVSVLYSKFCQRLTGSRARAMIRLVRVLHGLMIMNGWESHSLPVARHWQSTAAAVIWGAACQLRTWHQWNNQWLVTWFGHPSNTPCITSYQHRLLLLRNIPPQPLSVALMVRGRQWDSLEVGGVSDSQSRWL